MTLPTYTPLYAWLSSCRSFNSPSLMSCAINTTPSSPRASCALELHSQRSWLAKGSAHLSSVFASSFNQNVSVKSAGSAHWRPQGSSTTPGRFLPCSRAALAVREQLLQPAGVPRDSPGRSWQVPTAPLRPPGPVHLERSCSNGTLVQVVRH